MLTLSVALAFTQTTASIKGTVTDSSNAAIPGATVTIKNTAGIDRQTQTNSTGYYEVPALPPGTYSVEVKATGFQIQEAKDVILQVSQDSLQNFTLKVASTTEVVTVEGTAPVIETGTVTVGQAIDQRTVQEIPLNGRHFVDLGLLIPGTVTPPQNGFLTAPLRGQGSFAINTAGNREDTVNFMVNGINLNDMVQNQITFQPSINTVSEFKVDNSTYSAEYGRNSGAIANIATRSGTDNYHGEVFDFLRNNYFDARNFFNKVGVPQSPFIRNQFGANFGGPIVKDKTFFFLSYEGLRQRQGLTINTQVLTNAQRQQVTTVGNPVSVQLLNFIPAANDPTGTLFIGSATAPVNIDQGTADISHNFSSNVRLHAYYAAQHDQRGEPTLQGDTVPGFGDTRESKRQIATLNLDQTFTSNTVNELRFGFNRIHITFTPNSLLNPVSLGILDGNNFKAGLPFTSIGQTGIVIGGPNGFPQGRGDTTGVVSDTLNVIHGKHSLKFGGEFRRFYNNNFNGDTGTMSFLNVTQFANGTPNGFSISPGQNPSRIGTGELGFFGQDSWRVRDRLTLELGLRYDWNQTPREVRDRFVNLILSAPGVANFVTANTPYRQNAMNFQPRVGFAWDAFGNGKTVVRSGYALLTDEPITNLVTPLTNNPPLGAPVAFVGGNTKTTTYANLLSAAAAGGLAPTIVDPNFRNSYIQSYNLNIQHQLASKWSVMTGYFGSVGRNLRTRVNANQLPGVGGLRPFQKVAPGSQWGAGATLGNISENTSIGNSSYNALWITSNMQAWHGLEFNASYTYSKSLDYTSQNGQGVVLQNSLNPAGDKGLSDYDARQRFSMNFIYSVPVLRHNRLFEGWQIGSVIQDQTGNPVNLSETGFTGLTGLGTLRPDLTGPITYVNTPTSNGNIQWFAPSICDPAATPGCTATFSISDAGGLHFGNMGRNVIIGPRFDNVDFSLVKRTKITERFTHEFRLEAFDVLNHPNFGQPSGSAQVGNARFGVINSTRFPVGDFGSARQLQFAMKLLF
jgi:outer membrane receptor protein involved in Fe transport